MNSGREDDALAHFIVQEEDPDDPFTDARLPEFRPYESTAAYAAVYKPPPTPPTPTNVTPYHPMLVMPTPKTL